MADEFLHATQGAIWTTNPVKYEGKFFRVPESYINQKPVQNRIPRSIWQRLPAWHSSAWLRWPMDGIRGITNRGHDPDVLGWQQMAKRRAAILVAAMRVRANLQITDQRLEADRGIFAGTLDQIREDAQACGTNRAHELIYDVTFEKQARTSEGWLHLMETPARWFEETIYLSGGHCSGIVARFRVERQHGFFQKLSGDKVSSALPTLLKRVISSGLLRMLLRPAASSCRSDRMCSRRMIPLFSGIRRSPASANAPSYVSTTILERRTQTSSSSRVVG